MATVWCSLCAPQVVPARNRHRSLAIDEQTKSEFNTIRNTVKTGKKAKYTHPPEKLSDPSSRGQSYHQLTFLRRGPLTVHAKSVARSKCLSLQHTTRRQGFTNELLHGLWTVIKETFDNLSSVEETLCFPPQNTERSKPWEETIGSEEETREGTRIVPLHPNTPP